MEPEVRSSTAARAAAKSDARGKPPARGQGPATRDAARVIDGRAEDRHIWAVAALVVPLLFCAIVGVGVFLMFHRNMGYFKPAPSGSSAPIQARELAAGRGSGDCRAVHARVRDIDAG